MTISSLRYFAALRYLTAIFLLVIITTTSVYADASATDLSRLLNDIKTLRANFAQTVYDNKGKAIQRSSGRIALQRPGKFRWQVTKPIPQVIIANASRLWIYDPDLQQVTIRTLQGAAGETPALLLSHVNTSIEKDFSVQTLAKKSSNLSWFHLKPKKRDDMFSSIEMGFLNKQIQEMRLKDNLGHTTVIQFKNIETNVTLTSSLFTFKPSANIDVIDETKRKKKR
jgi:outer membrane lipoprotein carrier protein